MSEQGFPVNSRFRILDSPLIQPGKCAVCGAVDRPVVDFDTTVQLYGAILLCFSCVQEASRGVGMVAESELNAAKESLAQSLSEQLRQANLIGISRDRYDDIVVAVGGLSDALLFGSAGSNVVVAGPHGEIQSPLFDDDAALSSDTEGLAQGDTGSSTENDNSAVSERPTSLSSGNGDGVSNIRSI